jgi:nucleoside-diphosphate-sugar epimerase
MEKIVIIGLGWFGMPLALALRSEMEVVGTKSTPEGVQQAKAQGIAATLLQLTPALYCPDSTPLEGATRAVVNIPPTRGSAGVADGYFTAITSITRLLEHVGVHSMIFVSSTGVFGASQTVVDEHTPPQPDTPQGEQLLKCEQWLRRNFKGRVDVLRPAGLVSKGRHPGRFLAGKTDVKGPMHPVNLVHRDDLIAITRAILNASGPGRTYHAVAPMHPAKMEYYTAASQLLQLPLPLFDLTDRSTGRMVLGDHTSAILHIDYTYENPLDMF